MVALILALGLLSPSAVRGHAELVASEPAANASLPTAPDTLGLEFSEAIDPATASVRLLDAQQHEVNGLGELTANAAATHAEIALPELEAGVYTVDYTVVSAVDGHVTAGIFAFLVDPTGTAPAPALAPSSESPSADGLTIAARWLALVGALVLFGVALFWLASCGPHPVPWAMIAGAAFTAFGGLVIYLTLAARSIAGVAAGEHGGHSGAEFPLDFAAPFGWTPFAIAMRVALAGTLLSFLLAAGRAISVDEGLRRGRLLDRRLDRLLLAGVLVAAGAVLLGSSFSAHAASLGGPPFAALDWLHLVSVAAWLGALPGVAALAVVARRARSPVRATIGTALRRHTRVALVAAPAVAITGIANSPLVIGQTRELLASGYGNLVLAKALLFSVAIALGSANHLLLRHGATRRTTALIAAEVSVAAIAVLVAAAMVTLQPAASRVPVLSSTAISAAHLYGTAGPSSVHLAMNLPTPGTQRFQAAITDTETGIPRDDIQKVFLVLEPPSGAELPEERVELDAQPEPGIYGARGAYTPIVGDWLLDVVIRRRGELDESTTFELPVVEPQPAQLAPPPDTGIDVPSPLRALWTVLPDGPLAWVPTLALLTAAAGLAALHRNAPLRLLLIALALVAGVGAGSQATVTIANAPPSDAAIAENPIEAGPESIAAGRRLYLANCTSCHGRDPAPAGRLGAAIARSSDGELAHLIANGMAGTRMPAFAGTLSEKDRWNLINYLHALSPSAR